MNTSRAFLTHGFMATSELEHLGMLAETHSAILEIGSWMGRSARIFADNTSGTVTCVDTWADDAYGDAPADMTGKKEWLFEQFSFNLSDHILTGRVIPIRCQAAEAPSLLSGKKFDLIFIDAGHNYEDVRADILNFRPFLAEGGLLCGHDLYPEGPYHPGVLQAVNEFIPKWRVVPNTTIWEAV